MIYVTTQAREELSRLLAQENNCSTNSFRLKNLGTRGLGLAIDERKDDDDSLEHKGQTVLVYDRNLAASRNEWPFRMRFVISREVTRHSHASVTVNWVTFPQS